VVLLVLAVVWGVLLVSWLRSRAVGAFADSVGTFRRHLAVLERATPVTVTPANRLRGGSVELRIVPPYRPGARPASGVRPGPAPRPGHSSGRSGSRSPVAAGLRRRAAQKRRRQVFFTLLALVAVTLSLAVVSGSSIVWLAQAAADVLLAAYVGLLIQKRNLAAERDLKLTFMPQHNQPGAVRRRPVYDLGSAAYGELALRRAAN
jgi:hypothetical protein